MKKALKIIIAVIVIIAVIIGGIFAYKFIKLNRIRKELSQINAEELETKLIKELEKSRFNIESVNGIESVKIQKADDGYVNVMVSGDKDRFLDYVRIPILKIDSDDNGKFQGVEYVPVFYYGKIIHIQSMIFDVLENEFNVKGLNYRNKTKLIKTETNTIHVDYMYEDTLLLYINEISTRSEKYQSIAEIEQEHPNWNKTSYFGINVNN